MEKEYSEETQKQLEWMRENFKRKYECFFNKHKECDQMCEDYDKCYLKTYY
jgi:hypothetical protein